MNMRSPIVAILWENWHLSRVEVGQRLGLGLVLGASAMMLSADKGPTIAFGLLMLVYSMVWFAIAKLSGGRLSDGYKPGFPLHLLYTRPVPTTVFVGVAIFYNAISCTALYLVSAGLLAIAFGKPLPLLSVTLFLVAWHLAYTCVQWSTRSRVFQWIGSIAFSLPMYFLLQNNVMSPLRVEFSLGENAVLVLIGIVSIAVTFAGVARQRRGDAVSVVVIPRQKEWSGGFPDWLVTLFRFRCPTSSATKAQVWFELKSSGLPVLVIGLGVAVLIFLACAVGTSFGDLRLVVVTVATLALPIALFGLGGNAFGIRRRQGRTYASAFELTQPYGTAQLASLKVLVRAACVLLALMAIGASLWVSGFVSDLGSSVVNNNQDVPELLKVRQKIAENFGALTGYAYAAIAIVASITVVSVVAWQAAREALRARYPRLLLVVQWLPTVWGLASILLALAHRNGLIADSVLQAFFAATFWLSGAGFLLATIYMSWNGLTLRALTARYVGGALAVAAAFGAAWLAGMPATSTTGILWPVLLILMIGLLAPWSLNRIRHA